MVQDEDSELHKLKEELGQTDDVFAAIESDLEELERDMTSEIQQLRDMVEEVRQGNVDFDGAEARIEELEERISNRD